MLPQEAEVISGLLLRNFLLMVGNQNAVLTRESGLCRRIKPRRLMCLLRFIYQELVVISLLRFHR